MFTVRWNLEEASGKPLTGRTESASEAGRAGQLRDTEQSPRRSRTPLRLRTRQGEGSPASGASTDTTTLGPNRPRGGPPSCGHHRRGRPPPNRFQTRPGSSREMAVGLTPWGLGLMAVSGTARMRPDDSRRAFSESIDISQDGCVGEHACENSRHWDSRTGRHGKLPSRAKVRSAQPDAEPYVPWCERRGFIARLYAIDALLSRGLPH